MSDREPDGPYIYQPYGMQHAAHWSAGRIYAIGGLPHLATVTGLTKGEAAVVLAALRLHREPSADPPLITKTAGGPFGGGEVI